MVFFIIIKAPSEIPSKVAAAAFMIFSLPKPTSRLLPQWSYCCIIL